ncbi:MAG: MFS transporter [Elusimicrobiota bacterium]
MPNKIEEIAPIQNARRTLPATPAQGRAVWAWAFYDFANSPFATTITAVIFNVYFAKVVAKNAPLYGDTIWGILVAISTLLAGILCPFLGALADLRGTKKPWLAFSAAIGSLATMSLFWSGPGTLLMSSVLFIVANLSFSLSLGFYNAFLNDLATDKTIGRVSGLGWALGYVGGGLCLAINLAMIQKPEIFGLPTANDIPVRMSCLICGLWWGIFTVPLILWVPEKKTSSVPADASWKAAWELVVRSIKSARTYNRNLFRCLIAYLLYNDGIETVVIMAGLFASQALGMTQGQIIACFLMIQFVAFFGAIIFGKLGDAWGNKKALQLSLTLWAAVLFWALFMKTQTEFWIAGAFIAIVLGGSQSLSRSLFGKLVPKGSEAQFYGFQNLSSKISATLGPLAYGVSREITGSPRIAILSMLIFFIAGQALLAGVQESAPRQADE